MDAATAAWCATGGAKIDRFQSERLHSFQYHANMDVPRVRAPEFPEGLDWIATSGRALTLDDLRGKITILDFWTYG